MLCSVKFESSYLLIACGCVPSLLVVWPEVTQPWGSMGSMVELMVTSKRTYVKGDLPGLLLPGPHPCGKPLLTHASTGDPPTPAGSFGSVCCGVTAPLLGVPVHTRFCLCPPRLAFSFAPVLWKSYDKESCWSSRSDSLGIPSPFVGSAGWEA